MSVNHSISKSVKVLLVLGLLLLTTAAALAQDGAQPQRGNAAQLPGYVTDAKLDAPVRSDAAVVINGLNASLVDATGTQRVVVRLTNPPLALVAASGARSADQAAALDAIAAQQASVIDSALALDGSAEVAGTVRLALNAVMLRIDASALDALAANPNVASINPVVDYELDLSETVPYIGATAVQDLGFDGSGVKVAVLDSGIDYTHAALGGSGDPNDFLNNDPTIIEPGTFPTAKVVGGTDFTGSEWPNAAEMPDPDPLDDGPEGGHGTHVADIIGGTLGVAPGADLYAVKVCSSVSTSCSGIALLQGMDWVLDPNDDGNMDDMMDVVNMSLGSTMGNATVDDLANAVENASAAGVLTVASAGNSSDIPYMHGTPAAAPSALAVAQTNVPSASLPLMNVTKPASIAGDYAAVFQPWSVPLEVTGKVQGNLVYGDTGGTNLNGCAPFTGNMANKIVLVDRGACAFSLKIKNISEAGAKAGIIGLIAPGDPFAGGDSGDRPIDIPGFMISQADSGTLKSGLAEGKVTIVFDPADGIALVQHMVGSSSRGPSIDLNQAKPDIGAPGASVSAIAGSGTETGPFGGTSGAAPMVTGSAALLMQAYPDRSWAEIKAVLMNTGETDIMNEAAFFGGYAAPISRIGGGEVRVDRAYESPIAAWDSEGLTGSLSFGFHDVPGDWSMDKEVTVYNYSDTPMSYDLSYDFRYVDDAGGEVMLELPQTIVVPAMGSTVFTATMNITQEEGMTLHPWEMNSGAQGANPDALTYNEYDGYITFTANAGRAADSEGDLHMAFHVLPRAAGDIMTGVEDDESTYVMNAGMAESYIDTFSLLGRSPMLPGTPPAPGSNQQIPDLKYFGVQTYPVPAGFCSADASFLLGFAFHTWERVTHANTVSMWAFLDMDNDGTDDYAILNRDFTLNNVTDGRNLAWVVNLESGDAEAFFFTDHNTNSGNFVLLACAEQFGLTGADMGNVSFGVTAAAEDFYFTGNVTDTITGMNVVPLGERFFTIFDETEGGFIELPPMSGKVPFTVDDYGDQLNETEIGLLWLYGPGAPADNEAKAWILVDQSATLYMPVVAR
jgi:subtilisin family serine protease